MCRMWSMGHVAVLGAAEVGRSVPRRFVVDDRLVESGKQIAQFPGRNQPCLAIALALSRCVWRQVIQQCLLVVLAGQDSSKAGRVTHQPLRVLGLDDLHQLHGPVVELVPNLQRQIPPRFQFTSERSDARLHGGVWNANAVTPALLGEEREFNDDAVPAGVIQNRFESGDVGGTQGCRPVRAYCTRRRRRQNPGGCPTDSRRGARSRRRT